jgi:hypothetical protein
MKKDGVLFELHQSLRLDMFVKIPWDPDWQTTGYPDLHMKYKIFQEMHAEPGLISLIVWGRLTYFWTD